MGPQISTDDEKSKIVPHLENKESIVRSFATKSSHKLKEPRFVSCRVVLLQGSHLSGNIVLFDTLKKDEQHFKKLYNASENYPQKSDKIRSKVSKKPGVYNEKILGELIFGHTPIVLKNVNSKIHFLPSYKQTLLTKLFQIEIPKKEIDDLFLNIKGGKTNVDGNEEGNIKESQETLFKCKHFGFGIILMLQSPSNEFNKQLFEVKASYLQNLIFSNFIIIELYMKKLHKIICNSIKRTIISLIKKYNKMGNNLDSIFQGITLNIRLSDFNLQNDFQIVQGVKDFRKFIDSFLHSQRLTKPLWFRKIYNPNEQKKIFEEFRIKFLKVMNRKSIKYDPSSYKKIVCSAFTAVLKYHLSWVIPFLKNSKTEEEQNYNNNSQNELRIQQICSIYGGVNTENQIKSICKVLVVGTDFKFIRDLLSILSFFLRCSNIVEKEFLINISNNEEICKENGDLINFYEITSKPEKETIVTPENETSEVKKKVEKKTIESILKVPVFKKHHSNKTYIPHHSLGFSLYADICSKYCGSFVLSGLPKNVDYFEDTISYLNLTLEEKFLDDTKKFDISHCVVIDVTEFMCNVITAKRNEKNKIVIEFCESTASPFVSEMVIKMYELMNLGVNDSQCEIFLNNKLQELYIISELMVDIIEKEKYNNVKTITNEFLSKELKVSLIDIEILKQIISLYRSDLLSIIE